VSAETRTEAEEASTNTTFHSAWVRQAQRVDCRSQVTHRHQLTTRPTAHGRSLIAWALVHSRGGSRRGRHRLKQRSLASNAPVRKCPESEIPLHYQPSTLRSPQGRGGTLGMGSCSRLLPRSRWLLAVSGGDAVLMSIEGG